MADNHTCGVLYLNAVSMSDGRRSADRRPQARRLDERSTRHGHEGRCDGERQEGDHASPAYSK